VDDEADVGLVDAHAEGSGGHHDVELVVEELLVDTVPLVLLPPGVVRLGAQPAFGERFRVGLRGLSRPSQHPEATVFDRAGLFTGAAVPETAGALDVTGTGRGVAATIIAGAKASGATS
jgi:hypothetical protein